MLRRSIPEGVHDRLNLRPSRIAPGPSHAIIVVAARGVRQCAAAARFPATRPCVLPRRRRFADLSRYSSSVALSASAGDSQQWEPSRRKPSDWKRRA